MHDRALLAWLRDPKKEAGIRFAQTGHQWDFWPYERLAALTCRAAWGLLESGAKKDDVICLVLRSGPEFIATFFGAMLAGCIPCPVAPVSAFQCIETYAEHLAGIFETAQPFLVITHHDLLSTIPDSAQCPGTYQVRTFEDLTDRIDRSQSPECSLSDLAMLQFTSGSTARCRGVKVQFEALETNVQAIRRWLHWRQEDSFASWMPLHHDMGLVGAMICSVVGRNDLWLLQPEHFVRKPLRYLQCFGKLGATLTATATFGLEYVLRKVPSEALEGLDFSAWQGMVIGAERIGAGTLERFFTLLSPFGFRKRVLLPAYGMAEATLAITGLHLEENWAGLAVQPSSLSMGKTVAAGGDQEGGHVVVGCGWPLDGVSIEISDPEGHSLPESTVGEIVVRGASVAAGYVRPSASTQTQFENCALRTGDAGFVVNGQLFVLGRLGDSLKVRGCVVFSEDLEVALADIGIPRERLAALLGVHCGIPTSVILLERCREEWRARVKAIIRQSMPEATAVLIDAAKGTILRTSSGKPKRGLLWNDFVRGSIQGRIIE